MRKWGSWHEKKNWQKNWRAEISQKKSWQNRNKKKSWQKNWRAKMRLFLNFDFHFFMEYTPYSKIGNFEIKKKKLAKNWLVKN